MKAILTVSFLLGLIALAFVSGKFYGTKATVHISPNPPIINNNITNNFLIGSLSSVVNYDFQDVNDLGLNMWHSYTGGKYSSVLNRNVPTGWRPEDIITNGIDNYKTGVWEKLDSINNNNGMRSFMQRPKIEWLCYGQRSDYQCEDTSIVKINTPDLFFYSFQSVNTTGESRQDNTSYGGGIYVKRCLISADEAGYVVNRLKCNTEQSKPSGSGNQWQADEESTWFIKPNIRIDKDFANNLNNWDKLVCRIDIISDWNTLIKSIDIRVRNFKPDQFSEYDGYYTDKFNFSDFFDTSSNFRKGNWGRLWEWRSRGNWYKTNAPSLDSVDKDTYRSKADIKVYWYGNCDMWIDRVRVDNDVADRLFKGLDDPWIEQEATVIAGYNSSPLKFYIELAEFNNLPCIAYVNEKLQSLGVGVDMVTDVTYFYALHVNWDNGPEVFNAGHIKRNYIDKIHDKQILMESYPLTSTYFQNSGISNTYSRIPNTLSIHSGNNILAGAVNPADYDEWLQENLDHNPYMLEQGSTAGIVNNEDGPTLCNYSATYPPQDLGNFRYIMKTAREISRLANIPFIYMQQAHHWFTPGEVRREPTNEEMKLLTNLSVSYGAKGIIYYWYANHTNDIDCDYSYGLTEGGLNFNPRQTNVYGQPKWDSLKRDIQRLKT